MSKRRKYIIWGIIACACFMVGDWLWVHPAVIIGMWEIRAKQQRSMPISRRFESSRIKMKGNKGIHMEKIIKIEKNSVQETLMLPLYGKVVCMQTWPKEFHDHDCERIMDQIDYDFSELDKKFTGMYRTIAGLSR